MGMAGGGRSHEQGSFGGDLIGPNPTDRAKPGSKRSVLVEADGGPLSVVVAGANVHDTKLLEATLEDIVVERPEPSEEDRPNLCLDKAYDNPTGRKAAAKYGYIGRTYVASVRRSWTPQPRKSTLHDDGWWNGRSHGYPSADRSWFATTRSLLTTWV